MCWCAGSAGVLYEEALLAMQSILTAANEGHWRGWIEQDIETWRSAQRTSHHRSAYGGMGSFNDLHLVGSDTGQDEVWLDAALDACRHIAASVAPIAEQSPASFRQVSPGSSTTGAVDVRQYICGNSGSSYVTSLDRLRAAAAAWSSWAVPDLIQGQRGRLVAEAALGRTAPDNRPLYITSVDDTIDQSPALGAEFDSYADWHCPSCGHRQWTTSGIAAF